MLEHIRDKVLGLKEEERRKFYSACFSFPSSQALGFSELMEIIQKIPSRDEVRIFLSLENEDPFIIAKNSTEAEYRAFIEETREDEMIFTKIEINKTLADGHFSIYRYQKFVEDIVGLSMEDVLKTFSMFLDGAGKNIVFELFDSPNIFYTKTMYFLPVGNREIDCNFSRTQRLLACRDNTYFYNQDSYGLLPDDFKIEVGYEGNPFKELFMKLETILAASFIASNATIQGGQMKLQIMGQRSVDYVCRLNEITGNQVLYKIYDWIYSGGSSIDKAIIARNIICLHCKYEPLLNLDEKVLSSIQSNYNLYLKDNVGQYLELKNKVAEFISDIVSRTGEYATELLDKFKANVIAIFGFLFTVVIAGIVSDQPLNNIFTKDITVILELVLVGSVVYLFICYGQSKYQMNKVYESYEKLKKSYDKILTEDDIQECFQGDHLISDMKKTIGKSEKIYLFLWVVFLLVLLVIVEYISEAPVVVPFLKKIVGLFYN